MKNLIHDYKYKVVKHEEFQIVFQARRKEVFGDTFTLNLEKYTTDRENEFYKTLKHLAVFRLFILVYKGEDIIGWHVGFQKGPSYYMMNTAVIESHQRNGIYTKLLEVIIEKVYDKGFIDITSSHLASNNAVIIPKLKAGFLITGMNIEERFGVLINLKYFFNEQIKKAYLLRTGEIKPSNEMLNNKKQ